MKGFVFSFTRRKKKPRSSGVRHFTDLRGFFKRYGAGIFYTVVFTLGLLFGTVIAGRADSSLLKGLDFLFTTNLEARLNQPMYMTFVSSFASDFLFLLFVFLCGISTWSMALSWVAPAFKGFGTGLSAGYLFITFGFRGVGFYLLVILLGTFLFSFALIIECVSAHYMSMRIAKRVFSSSDNAPVLVFVKSYLLQSLYMLLITAVSALVDMLFWSLFSGLFF